MLKDNAKPTVTEQCEANSNENLKIKDYPSLTSNKDVRGEDILIIKETENNSIKPLGYEGCNINSGENLLELEIPNTQMLRPYKSSQQEHATSMEYIKENNKAEILEGFKSEKEDEKEHLESDFKAPLRAKPSETSSFQDNMLQGKPVNLSELSYKTLIFDKIEKVGKQVLSKILNTDNLGIEFDKGEGVDYSDPN